MRGTLVDTNVLLDIVTDDVHWADWSERSLDAATLRGPVFINDVIYAELSVRFARIEELDNMIDKATLVHAQMPRSGLFLAAKAFRRYRAARGQRTGVLPDFFIGAHAAVAELILLTRDAARYRNYFPMVQLVAP